ncbi:MAG: hypothetical protein WD768_16825 [Phycisphaeraceae bacterium]
MPSNSLKKWNGARREALDQIAAAHTAVGGVGPGRRYATQQINQAYATLLSSQFQGFCRDLHSEAVDHICNPGPVPDVRLHVLRTRLTTNRKLDRGNPNPGNLGSDFGYFDFDLWAALKSHDAANEQRNKTLEVLNAWRNAIAHQDFDPGNLGGRTTVLLKHVRAWRRNCEELAVELDAVVGVQVGTIIGVNPW